VAREPELSPALLLLSHSAILATSIDSFLWNTMTPEESLRIHIESLERSMKGVESHIENQKSVLQFALWNVGVAASGRSESSAT
jgi:hypothetical protein